MKTTFYRVLTIILLVVLMATLAFSVFAANKATASQDGIYVAFTTDKSVYTAEDTIKTNLMIVNNAATKADVEVQLLLPQSILVMSGEATQKAAIDSGAQWNAEEVSLAYDPTAAVKESNLSWIWWVVGGVVLVAGVVLLLIYGKNLKSHVSILLLVAMVLSFVTMAIPAEAATEQKSFDVSTEVEIDGADIEIGARIIYTLEEAAVVDEEIDDGRLVAFYFNDFEDPDRWYTDGAQLNYGSGNEIGEEAGADGNHYGYINIIHNASTAYFQADLMNSRVVKHLVFRIDISTKSYIAANSNVQYRYNGAKNYQFLNITKDGTVKLAGIEYPDLKVEKDKWLQLEFVFDFTADDKDTAEVYVNDKKYTDIELPKSKKNYAQPYFRIYSQKDAKMQATYLFDNVAVYESDVRLPLDQIKSPKIPHGERRVKLPDVEMIHPKLSDLGADAVAFLAGSKNIYAKEALTTMNAAAQAVTGNNELLDVKVPGAVLKQYLGVSGLDDNTLYSVKEYAGGKNVIVDSRGLVIVSSKKLDATKDIKLLTMVYGYLKTGVLAENYAAAPAWSETVIKQAYETPIVGFGMFATSSANYQNMRALNALYYLMLIARMDSSAKGPDGTLVKDEAMRRLRFVIAGGNEPNCQPGCFWDQATTGNIITLARHTPLFWNALTKEEQGRMDLLMECLVISTNFAHNTLNNYKSGLDLRGNFSKSFNNNFKSASWVNYINACMYFGSAEKVDEIFINFKHSNYIKRIQNAGFTNIYGMWTNEDLFGISIGMYMEFGGEVLYKPNNGDSRYWEGTSVGTGVGAKTPWSYTDVDTKEIYTRDDFYPMLFDYFDEIHSWGVISSYGIPGEMTYSYIISGKQSPYQGQMGMMTEFAGDSEGRSKCMYCYLSAQVISSLYANLKLLGYWEYDEQTPEVAKTMREFDSRLFVGAMDLFFKLREGYMGNSQKKPAEELQERFYYYGLNFVEDVWYNFHAMENYDVNIIPEEKIMHLEPGVEPMNGSSVAPKGAFKPIDTSAQGGYIDYRYQNVINGKCYYEGTMEFDLVFGDILDNEFNGVIAWGQKREIDFKYSDMGMLMSLRNGDIMAYDANKGEYDATGFSFGSNYRFHIKVDFNCKTKRYSVTTTQTWPKTDKPSRTLKDMWFRNDEYYVESIVATWTRPSQSYWLENATISGKTREKTPYSPFRELNVKVDWSEVPVDKRPSSIKAYLVYNGIKQPYKYVTLTAADGWKMKSFDHVPTEIRDRVANYSVYIEPAPGYMAMCSEIDKNNTITVTQTRKPVIYNSDFQDGKLGKLLDTGEGKTYFATEGENKYLVMDNKNKANNQIRIDMNSMYLDGKLNDMFSVIFFEMDLRKANKDSLVSGYALGYRKDRTDGQSGTSAHYLIRIDSNVVKISDAKKTYTIGTLTDDWQKLKVCYDVANNRVLVSYGADTNYMVVDNLPVNRASAFWAWTKAQYCGLALDNMKVYCDYSKNIDSVLNSMTTDLSVNIDWAKDVPETSIPDTVKVFLSVNGQVTDKYVTLKKSENWSSKVFKNLKVVVDGVKQEYALVPQYLYGVMPVVKKVGNEVSISVCTKITYYDNDFTGATVQPYEKQYRVPDKNGNVFHFNTGMPSITGSNPYLVYSNSTSTISSTAMKHAKNLFVNLKLKSDEFVNGGNIALRYIKEDNKYEDFFKAENAKGVVKCTFFGKNIATMTEGEWLNLQFRLDFENRISMVKVNDGAWEYAYDCPQRTGNVVRLYSNAAMTWAIDDMKLYSDCSWTTGETESQTSITVKVNWDNEPVLPRVRVNLLRDGKPVTDSQLRLNTENDWTGTWDNLPVRDVMGNLHVYTYEIVDKPTDYNTYLTNGGNTINFTKMNYYYWNDFEGKSMTDGNGTSPGVFSGGVTYLGEDNVYVEYQGTVQKENAAIKTAENVMFAAKINLAEMTPSASIYTRFAVDGQPGARYIFFQISVDKNGNKATVYLAGNSVCTIQADKWYDIMVGLDQVNNKAVLYIDGKIVGKPATIPENISSYINMYSGSGKWYLDDLRIFSNPSWDWLDEILTLEDKKVTVNWAEGTPALDNVTIQLYCNGTAVDGKTLTLNAANSWSGIFEDLPSHDANANELIYTVQQVETLDGYQTYLTGNGFTLNHTKNHYYYWNDYTNGTEIDDQGVEFKYFGEQFKVENGYVCYTETSLLSNAAISTAPNIVVSFKLKAEQFEPGCKYQLRYKIDGNDNYNVLEVLVNKNGDAASIKLADETVGTFQLSQWYEFTVLIDRVSGKVFLFDGTGAKLAEAAAPAYTGNYIKMWSSMEFQLDDMRIYTDTQWDYYEQYKVDVDIDVVWDDNANAEGYRPQELTVKLYADGVFVKDVTVYDVSWKATVEDLPEYNKTTGNKVVYTVVAQTENYTPSYNGTDVTMKLYLPGVTVDETFEIVWNDKQNTQGKRPTEVTLQLYADDVAVDGKTLVLKESDGWKGTFTEIPKYNEQTMLAYTYTVKVVAVDYYDATYAGNTVTMNGCFKVNASVVIRDTAFAD